MSKEVEISPIMGGALMVSLFVFRSMLTGASFNSLAMAGIMLAGILVNRIFQKSEYDKLFQMCGLENKNDEVPLVIKEEEKNNQKTLVLHVPEGLSQKHFEQKQQELEQALNAKIEFGFNKNLVMKLTSMNLSSHYPYEFQDGGKPLRIYCGMSHEGPFFLDIAKAQHIIVAGETGSGKSSLLRDLVLSLILNRHDVDLHLVDFQAVELGIFENCRKVKSYGETPEDFEKLINDMEEENRRRLDMFRSVKNRVFINSLQLWNEKFPDKAMPYKVVVVDEFARLAEKDYEDLLKRFRSRVSMDRKVGIHYIVSMQRPDVKCIEGSIKANMPTRIAFKTVSQVDSEVILDQKGAENLKQPGRFLIKYCGEIKEAHALYIEADKVRKLLRLNKAFKTREELQTEKADKMKKLRENCINPYVKKVIG